MDFLPMLSENYDKMSQGFFDQYTEATNYLKSLGCTYWNIPDHTKEENAQYFKAMSMRFHSALAAIVFQALAIEAYVNYYGVHRVGEKVFYQSYESKVSRKSTKDKLKLICKEILKKPYPTDCVEYSRLVELLKDRDRIVHTKPRAIPLDGNEVFPNYEQIMGQYNFIYDHIEDKMKSYSILKKNLAKLDGSNEDLIERNLTQYLEATQNAIEIMFTFNRELVQDDCIDPYGKQDTPSIQKESPSVHGSSSEVN